MADNTTKGKAATTRKRRASIKTEDVTNTDEVVIDASSNIALDDIDRPDLAVVTGEDMESPHVQEYVKELAFMNEKITIMVPESSDPNAINPVLAGVNGEIRAFNRGQEYTVERKFVDSLIKHEDKVTTRQYKDAEGLDQTEIVRKPVLKHPVAIINDPSGESGRRWFNYVCNN